MIYVLRLLVAVSVLMLLVAGALLREELQQQNVNLLQDIDAVLAFGLALVATVTGIAGLAIVGAIRAGQAKARDAA